ncbi:hypothetical protein LIER_21589 [Lithospermum erythrorhizon]|uniref:Reverse transcriptase domain-containing protein n=1 Tax=Lithospermum erythrorhizon TaxID=34254 RepID=A0AAV3QT64_LITER
MANRIRPVLMEIISNNQSAFFPGRFISDNILIAHEVLYFMNSNKRGKNTSMAIKLDMSKAYDRVERKFLEYVMHKLGFSSTWIDWTMSLVSSVSYSSLLNGAPKVFVRPTRGIRQWDPLSPYLFLLCAKGLLALLRRARETKAL